MPSRAIWSASLRILAAALGIFLFVRVLLPVLLPFLIGLALALLGCGLFFLGRILFRELSGFLRELPSLLSSLSGPLTSVKLRLYALAARLPDGLGTGLRTGLDHFFQSSGTFAVRAYEWLFQQASAFLSGLPGAVSP